MKNVWIILALAITSVGLNAQDAAAPAAAQEESAPRIPSVVFAPNLVGPIFGYYGADINFKVNDQVTADTEVGYFNFKTIPLVGSALSKDADFWYGYLKAGPTYYFGRSFHGFYGGAYIKMTYFTIGDSSAKFNAGSGGLGAKLGWRGTWDWFSLALGGGYEFNKSFAEVKSSNSSFSSQMGSIEGAYPYFTFKMEFAVY